MGLRFLQHKVLGYAPFTVIHGTLPKVPLTEYAILPSDEWEAREFSVPALIETCKFLHEEVMGRLAIADMKNKLEFDKRQKRFQ